MTQKFLIEGLEIGGRSRPVGDWRFRWLPRRVGRSRLSVVHQDQNSVPVGHNGNAPSPDRPRTQR